MKLNKKLQDEMKSALKKYGCVEYITDSMFAPPDYNGPQAPYVTEPEVSLACALAAEKLSYIHETKDQTNTTDPSSYLDLRDGGDDNQGIEGKPIMTGWLTYAKELLKEADFIESLQQTGKKIADDFGALLVIGIGGSYTNIEGIINAIKPKGTRIPIYFLGQHLSAESYSNTIEKLNAINKPIAINIISKSGTTTEPAIAARIALNHLDNVGAVFATTDLHKGALRETIKLKKYNPIKYLPQKLHKKFYIGSNIGGRFSAITAVGLLPFAVAEIPIREFLLGYQYAIEEKQNIVIKSTACRFVSNQYGAATAVLAYNCQAFRGKILGYRQLWPECDGKDGKGINIMEEFYTADAHSNGQLIKSGPRNMMEIFHFIEKLGVDYDIPDSDINLDNLGGISKSAKRPISLHKANNLFMKGLLLDHWHSGVPVMAIKMPNLSPFIIGMAMGIEHLSATVYGLMIGINPLNQPGVQGYKEIVFSLLGMKGNAPRLKTLRQLKDLGL